ncbi:hypothetical protein PQX77_020785 [Marasmius sp. AFHP31]|nr:hypothetical protein PQX77_020785 [Marasmius sp. AFHP31]
MLDLQKHFSKDLFNGKDFLQKYKPTMEGVSKTKALWECLIGEWKDIPPPEGSTNSRTIGTGDNARTETTTTPPSKQEVADWVHAAYPYSRLAIPKVWEAAASKCLHDFSHELDDDNASSNDGNNNIRIPCSPSGKPGLTLDRVQDAIMVEYERLNPQSAGQLTAVKRSGTNAPLFQQQQQRPRPPQRQQQRGQQQQQQNQQQHAPPWNQDKGKKKKQQQQGMHGGIDRDAGSSNRGGNRPHGHSHFVSVASTITPPFSSVIKRKDRVALNAIEQSLRAEIATKPDNLWAGYRPLSTWDKTYPDLNFKAVSHLPSSRARGSPPPATFKGFWDELCNSTLTPPPPAKKKNPANMQKFTGFKPSESVFEDVCESRLLANRIGVPKTAQDLKLLEDVVATETCCTDQLASKARSSVQECIGAVASSSKHTLEDDDGPRYLSTSSSKRARSVGPDEDEDVEMDDGNDLTSLFGNDVDDDIAKAAGVEEDEKQSWLLTWSQ